ncbi:MAG: carbohydrate porin [Asticcacaulis sp.]|uniref:carbohydrate porin n=1 Tax=Asticcacaulis sp. TaxID=1872648 RepID=UPI003F7BAF84
MHNLDLTAAWSGNRGWDAFAYVLVDGGGGFSSRYSGDLQTVSNIDAVPAARLFEAWAHYRSRDSRWQTTIGLINLNSIFDTQPVGSLFLNSSDGIGPDYSQAGPSIFPVTGPGVVAEWRMTQATSLRAGLFDGAPGDPEHPKVFVSFRLRKDEGLQRIVEVEHRFGNGFVKLGHWDYTIATRTLDAGGLSHRQGSYAQIGLSLISDDSDGDRGLKGWLRAGIANDRVLKLDRYIGGGLVCTGCVFGPARDRVGVSIMQAHLGAPFRAVSDASRATETTTELTYQRDLNDHLTVQPDLQYVRNPGGDGRLNDAAVVGVRFRWQ